MFDIYSKYCRIYWNGNDLIFLLNLDIYVYVIVS